MTVSTEIDHNDYVGNGVTTQFPYTFRVFKKSDLVVTVLDLSQNITTLILDTDYTVSGAGGYSGGNVTLSSPLTSGWQISITRQLPVTQETDLRNQGKFFAEVHEDAFDRLTMLIQQVRSLFGLSLRKPSSIANWYDALNNYIRNLRDPSQPQDAATKNYVDSLASSNLNKSLRTPENIPAFPAAATRANKIVAFDALGNPVAIVPTGGSAADVLLSLANPADGSGADLVAFLQAGLNAVPRSVKSKLREYVDLEDYGTIDRSGETLAIATANTVIINRALAAAASLGKALRLSSGVILALPFSIPTSLPGLMGRGAYSTTIKFYRQSYTAGTLLINAQNNTASPEFCDFAIDCDDAVFKTSVGAVFPYTGTDNILINRMRVTGRGDNCVITQNSKNCRIYDLTVNATGGAGATFNTCFFGQNCSNSLVVGMRTTGFPTYCGTFSISSGCKFIACHGEGTNGAFAWSISASSYCGIFESYSENSSHEAFQLTDTEFCLIAFNNMKWDAGYGQDAGISIHGKTMPARFNTVISNTINNSYAAGLMAADNALYNTFAFNTLKDAAVRGTASGLAGTFKCAIGQYTALNSQQCVSNKFIENVCLSESGTTQYGYAEFVNGTGSVVADTTLRYNSFYGAFTTRYLTTSAVRRTWDIDALSFTPVIASSGGGGSFTYTITSAKFRRDGDYCDMTIDFTIGTVTGTVSGILITWVGLAPLPDLYQGAFNGKVIGTGKSLIGVPSGSGVVLTYYDASTPAVSGARVTVVARYVVTP
ncbi:hypothetical protein ACNSOB_06830 [Citrobacter braakii]|uniref:hypothetical protein n=1 Tax=Citrobacter braakii TaxID=57706 RepID=UPI003AB81A6A